MNIVTIFSIIFSILIIGVVIWMLLYPEPLKPLIHTFYPNNEYEANANARAVDKRSTLYSNEKSKHERLIVIFIGGGGLYSKQDGSYGFTNLLNNLLSDAYDILIFEYPTRFTNTIHKTMLTINEILVNYIHYPIVHAIGISFGSLLAGAFYHKETSKTKATNMQLPQIGMKFKSFAIFSGIVDRKFNAKILNFLFDFYIMRNTPGKLYYTCYNIALPKYLVTATTDFLVAQSVRFIESEQCVYKIYQNKILPHAFCQYNNLEEATDSIKKYVDFVKKVDSHQ